VSRVTEAIDLYPSLANAAGIVPPAGLSGHDQFDPGAKPGIAYSQAPGSWSLIEWPWKLVVFEQPARAAIFDLAHDAHELHDLAAEHSRELRRLLALGESLQKVLPRVGGAQPESAQTIDPETVEELKSLGYLQ
jgi:arylsulfatase A-like enzyme